MLSPQPHDNFAQRSLKERAMIVAFLGQYLSSELYARLELDTLQSTDTRASKKGLRCLHSDLVYACRIDTHTVYNTVLILIEHQSSAIPDMGLRMLEYSTRLLIDFRRQHPQEPLPLVYHLCLYHGTDVPYPYGQEIYEDLDSIHAIEPELV